MSSCEAPGRVLLALVVTLAAYPSLVHAADCADLDPVWAGPYVPGTQTVMVYHPEAFNEGPFDLCEWPLQDNEDFTGYLYGVPFGTVLDIYPGICTCRPENTQMLGLINGGQCTACATPTGANGDPHFTGFDGFKFDFQGRFDTSYNLVSTRSVQANIQIIERTQHFSNDLGRWHDFPQLKEESTWIGGTAIQVAAGDSVVVQKHLDRNLTVEFNGQPLALGANVGVPGGLQVRYEVKHYDAHDREAMRLYLSEGAAIDVPKVYVQAPPFTFIIDAPPTLARRLDVAAGLTAPPEELYGKVEGLLGHTVRPAHPLGAGVTMQQVYSDTTSVINKANNEVFKISAVLEAEFGAKYEVAGGLLGVDFPANLFRPSGDGDGNGLEAGDTSPAHRRELRAPGGAGDNVVHAWAATANMAPLFDAYAQIS